MAAEPDGYVLHDTVVKTSAESTAQLAAPARQRQPPPRLLRPPCSAPGTAMMGEETVCSGQGPETSVFRAVVTPPPGERRFSFPPSEGPHGADFDLGPSFLHPDPSPQYRGPETGLSYSYQETVPKRPVGEGDPGAKERNCGLSHQETSPKHVCQETRVKQRSAEPEPRYPAAETQPKYPYPDPEPRYPAAETQRKYPYQDPEPRYPAAETRPKYPYPDPESRYPAAETQPKYPYPDPGPRYPTAETQRKYSYPDPEPRYPAAETRPKDPCQETEPKRVLSPSPDGRRSSEVTAPRPRRLNETGGDRSAETSRPPAQLVLDDALLKTDGSDSLSFSSDMRDLQTHVHDSSNVHVGPKVFDQRNFHVERLNSHVDTVHQHEHVQKKHEHIHSKHEHVQKKTEVHNKTENIKHEHIQNKHEHIQVNKTEIVHNKENAIYVDQFHVHCDCRHDAALQPPPSSSGIALEEMPRFPESRKFLETRYTSWTTLSTPLPWYDNIVLDLSKSCVDFTMVSMGGSSVSTYSGVEQLVREQLDCEQQSEKALRIIVEGHAGYGKSTLAAKVAFDWATGKDYLKRYTYAFLIFLRELRGSLDEHIKSQHYPMERKDGDAFLRHLKSHQDKVLFIFDGYDELPKERREAIDQIMSGRAFVHSGAVMTSRPMQMSFKKYCQFVSLVGFDDSKKAEFVRLVYKDRPQMRIDDFLRVLVSDRSVGELAQCPLMCLLLCEMHQRGAFGGRATKSKLYEELFHYLVGKAVHRRHVQPQADDRARLINYYDEALAKFGQFCLECLARDQLSFTEQEISKCCEASRLFDVGFIVKCRNFSSYLGSETYYEPIHKTFVEFLAAKYLKSIMSEEDHLKRELLKLKQSASRSSERLILLYLCGLLKADAWTVMEQLDADDLGQGLDFAFSLLREAGESPQNVAAVCRRLPRDRVVIRGTDNNLAVWALCLSSPASEVYDIEFIWDFDSGRSAGAEAGSVAAQLGFWSALQSCANVTDLRVTFLYGHSSAVPPAFMDALCECMKNCARLAKLAVLHVKAIAPESDTDTFLPVVASLSQHVRTCAALHRVTVEMNLSSRMTECLCAGLAHAPRLQTLCLPLLMCDAAGFSAVADLIRRHVSVKTLDVSVSLAEGLVDLTNTSYIRLNRVAMVRNKKQGTDPDAVRKVPLHRAGVGLPRAGPDQELEHLMDVLALNLKDERRVRIVEGVWHLVDQAGSRTMYPLPMCDGQSHKGGYHRLFDEVRSDGARLENLVIGRVSLTKMDFVCLGETIRKSESLAQLTVVDVEKAINIFPLITALPAAKRLESVFLRSRLIQINDFLFAVFCRCLEHNVTLQELSIPQWKFTLESPSSVERLRSLMKNTSVKRLQLSECRVSLTCRVDDLTFPCASLSSLNLANCVVETSGGSLRGPAFLPLLQGLSSLKQLDLSHNAAPPLNDAAVKTFFGGLSAVKTLEELTLCGWRYDVANPETAYAETKAAAKKWSRLTTVRVDSSQFTARSSECSKQWLVQAMATGVPHLQELRFSCLSQADRHGSALTVQQVESLAKAILKAKWTGHALQLYMQQVDSDLMDAFVRLTRSSQRIDVTSDGRVVMLKRHNSGQWWRLRPNW